MPKIAPQVKPGGSGLPSLLEPGLRDEKYPILEDWLLAFHTPKLIQFRYPSEKYKTPATTAQDVGWPWIQQPLQRKDLESLPRKGNDLNTSVSQSKMDESDVAVSQSKMNDLDVAVSQKRNGVPTAYTLERFGRYARGRGDVLKWFGAREALP